MNCSTPGCTEPSVVQWAKVLSDNQASAHLADVATQLASVAEVNRLSIRVRIAALQDAHDTPSPSLAAGDVALLQAQASKQTDALRNEHNAIPTTFDLEHHRAGSVEALGSCEAHKHDNADWYAVAHSSSCSDVLECGCS